MDSRNIEPFLIIDANEAKKPSRFDGLGDLLWEVQILLEKFKGNLSGR